MSPETFDALRHAHESRGAAAALDLLIERLRADKQFHELFDALLLKKRFECGLPLARPASLRDVPETLRDAFEEYYVQAAREVGMLLLQEQQIAQAFQYFRAINETEPVAAAIEALPDDAAADDQVVEVALLHGVNPIKGLKLFLKSHGTCSTITALDQQFLQMPPAARSGCARVMVQSLYRDLTANVAHDVARREPPGTAMAPGQSLHELISGREWLFAEGNYHIDVSHLNAVVRFARALEPNAPEAALALELAEYGSLLAPQYQYAGNAPFEEFYPTHQRYFRALLGQNADEQIAWFRARIGNHADETDARLAAYTLVDLLERLGRLDEASDLACRHLLHCAEDFGISLADLCARAGRFDRLQEAAAKRADPVTWVAALIGQGAARA